MAHHFPVNLLAIRVADDGDDFIEVANVEEGE
jgi:hypothetical protein